MLEFVWDSRDLDVWRSKVVDKALARALRLAGNAGLRAMQNDSTERIKRRKFLRESDVRAGLPMDKPGTRDEIRSLFWRMRISGKPIPLGKFPHSQGRHGVFVSVNRTGGARKLVKGAFLATMGSGRRGIFKRRGKSRLPIDELYSSRLSDVIRDTGAVGDIHVNGWLTMEGVFRKGMARELNKLKRKGGA